MMVLTNALYERTDEGCLKVAHSLVKRMKQQKPDLFVATYDGSFALSDQHLKLNKLLFNSSLFRLVRQRRESVLYIPFPAKTIATALRIFVLSCFSPMPVSVLLVMKSPMSLPAKMLLYLSGAELIVLSRDAEEFYQKMVPAKRIRYLRTGIDTKKFVPVSREQAAKLKEKYGLDPNRPVVLHVGHLKYGRGVDKLLEIDTQWQVLLVASTLTEHEQDQHLRAQLMARPNTKIIDYYLPDIEEIYQLADVYCFPVEEVGNCIDVPLSCLEAAACNKPVVATAYGEMKEFEGKSGFYLIDKFEKDTLNQLISKVLDGNTDNPRAGVTAYDWNHAVRFLLTKQDETDAAMK